MITDHRNLKSSDLKRILRAARVITRSYHLAHSKPLLYSTNILTIYDLSHLAVLLFVYRATNNLLPGKFSSFLKPTDQIHYHYMQGSTKFNIPYARTSLSIGASPLEFPPLSTPQS